MTGSRPAVGDPDGCSGPPPDPEELAERLREAPARPWELPGWVDVRSVRPLTRPPGTTHTAGAVMPPITPDPATGRALAPTLSRLAAATA